MHANINLDFSHTWKSYVNDSAPLRLQRRRQTCAACTAQCDHWVDITNTDVLEIAVDLGEAVTITPITPICITTACHVHEYLCDAFYIAEDYYAIVMLMIVANSFLLIVFNSYYVLDSILQIGQPHIGNDELLFVAFLVYQAVIHALGLGFVVHSSSMVMLEVMYC